MSKNVSFSIDPHLYHHLEQLFKDDEQGLNQFIIDAIKNQLKNSNLSSKKEDDLDSYLEKGPSGSRKYGVKGQGW
jgi:hypothetical protein